MAYKKHEIRVLSDPCRPRRHLESSISSNRATMQLKFSFHSFSLFATYIRRRQAISIWVRAEGHFNESNAETH